MQGIQEIGYQQLQEKIQSNSRFVLYIGRPDCPDCQEFYPVLQKYIREHKGVYVYYVNVKAYRDASRKEGATQEEKDFFTKMQQELSFHWTPTLHLQKGKKIESTYTYLNRDYYKIKDKQEKKQKKEQFIKSFTDWMDTIYK